MRSINIIVGVALLLALTACQKIQDNIAISECEGIVQRNLVAPKSYKRSYATVVNGNIKPQDYSELARGIDSGLPSESGKSPQSVMVFIEYDAVNMMNAPLRKYAMCVTIKPDRGDKAKAIHMVQSTLEKDTWAKLMAGAVIASKQ